MEEQANWDSMSNEALLLEYKRTQDHELKKVLVMRYSYLVKKAALKLRGVYLSFAQVDDMINEGIILLMSELDKFDPEQNTKFETFVSKRLRGMIIDLARRQDWMPRSLRKHMREIDDATGALYIRLGRTPTDKEVADELGITEERYQELLAKTAVCNIISLDMLLDEKDTDTPAKRLQQTDEDERPEEYCEKMELQDVLKQCIGELRENEQIVLSLHYQKDLQMKEIAKVLGVSEPRASQIHSNAIRKLRMKMSAYVGGT